MIVCIKKLSLDVSLLQGPSEEKRWLDFPSNQITLFFHAFSTVEKIKLNDSNSLIIAGLVAQLLVNTSESWGQQKVLSDAMQIDSSM